MQGAQEPFYLGRLGKAQRKVMTDLMGKIKVFTSCGVRARFSRVSFHSPVLLHAERRNKRRWCKEPRSWV